jgi:hypothetical protein
MSLQLSNADNCTLPRHGLWEGIRRVAFLTAIAIGLALATGNLAAGRAYAHLAHFAQTTGDTAFDLLESFRMMDGTLGSMSPDVSLAVGRSHLLLARNSGIALWRKAAGDEAAKSVAAVSMSQFFAPIRRAGDQLTDPVALFDDEAGRFFVGNAAYNTCPDCGFQPARRLEIAVPGNAQRPRLVLLSLRSQSRTHGRRSHEDKL